MNIQKKIKTKRPYATLKKYGTVLLQKSPRYTLSILNPKEIMKEIKCNVCIQVVLLWLFVQYNFSENIHLDINSSTNVQNL